MFAGLDPFQELVLIAILVTSAMLLPAVAVGAYQRSWMNGWGVYMMLSTLLAVAWLIQSPDPVAIRYFLINTAVPFVLAARRYHKHRQFLRACGEFGLFVLAFVVLHTLFVTFIR